MYLHAAAAAKWLLAGLVTTSGWHSEPANQAAGKLGGSAPNGLRKIIPQNYPPELRHSCLALCNDGTWDEGECCWTDECVCVGGRFGRSSQCVGICVVKRAFPRVFVRCNDSGSVGTSG